jgi:hypothetical protein
MVKLTLSGREALDNLIVRFLVQKSMTQILTCIRDERSARGENTRVRFRRDYS